VKLEFTVHGDPKPQGSKRGFVTKTGKVAMVEMAGVALKSWREAIAWTARGEAAKQNWEVTDQPITMEVIFYMKKPQKPKFVLPAVRPDIDKLLRALLDGLTQAKTVYVDDSQVCILQASKTYGEPRVEIKLWKTL
jgi:Holliday junction resolvase RusA-like endonuclease